ncbi:MAG TPA: DUF2000 domain-containing protein [Azospirillum sp.]
MWCAGDGRPVREPGVGSIPPPFPSGDSAATGQATTRRRCLHSHATAAAAPEAIGEPYVDAAGRVYGRMLGQPMLVFAADTAGLQAAHRQALERGLSIIPYVAAMFETGHDAANRAVFAAGDPGNLDLVGLAVRGAKKAVDKATRGLTLHG